MISVDPLTVALSLGVPVLLLIFYFEGLVIGKILQPPVIFVGYVVAVNPPTGYAIGLVVGCGLAATLGQWTLYRGFNEDAPEIIGIRRTVPVVSEAPDQILERIGERRMAIVEGYFNRYGGLSIIGTNLIPGIRCLIAIPAGLSRYPVKRFLLTATCGNLGYMLLLVGAAAGVLGALSVLIT